MRALPGVGFKLDRQLREDLAVSSVQQLRPMARTLLVAALGERPGAAGRQLLLLLLLLLLRCV